MKDRTIYLLYNTNATDVKLHPRPSVNTDERGNLNWEYVEEDEFTITYSPDDDRQLTDVKILSKTKLKERPKSADVILRQPKRIVEGVFIRRSSSFSTVEDLCLVRRNPLIKPLLSESEIIKLQQLQEECRRKQLEYGNKSTLTNESDVQEFPSSQDFRQDTDRVKQTSLGSLNSRERSLDLLIRKNVQKIGNEHKSKRRVSRFPFDLAEKEKVKKENRKINYLSQGRKPVDSDRSVKAERKLGSKKAAKVSNLLGKHKKTKQVSDGIESSNVANKNINKKKTKLSNKPTGKKNTDKTDLLLDKKLNTKNVSSKSKQEISKTSINKSKLSQDKSDKVHDQDDSELEDSRFKSSKAKNKLDHQREKDKASTHEKLKENKSTISEKTVKFNKSEKEKSPQSVGKSSMSDGKGSSTNEKRTNEVENEKKKPKKDKNKSPGGDSEINSQKEGSTETGKGLKAKSQFSPQQLSTQSASRRKSKPSVAQLSLSLKKENFKEGLGRTKSKRFSNVMQYMIQYILSNPVFIKLGWTLPSIDRAMSRVVTFKTSPANPRTYCFRNRDEMEEKFYSSGTLAVQINKDGSGGIYYPSGSLAIFIKKTDLGMRLILYSNPKRNNLVKGSFHARVIGIFDSFGNGVVYDVQGKKLINFNQLEGVFDSPERRTQYKWRWSSYDILEKQRSKELLSSMVNEEKLPLTVEGKKGIGPIIGGVKSAEKTKEVDEFYGSILAELPYPVAKKSNIKRGSPISAFKSIILKINEEITLRINGQNNITLSFSSEKIFYKLDLGVRVDPDTVERVEELAPNQLSELPCVFNALLHLSPSMQELNQQLYCG